MPVIITDDIAEEESTFIFKAEFEDEDGAGVVPDSITWTLTDEDGAIINSRNAVSITPAAAVYVVLSGDDLALSGGFVGDAEARIFTIEAVYDSTYGNNLPLKDQATFYINNLVAVS